MNRFFATLLSALLLSACASSLPPDFIYETSLRGEQGLPGRAQRLKSAKTLLAESGVMDPEAALQAALPDAEIDMKRWGLKYFGKDWTRYQVVLDANIERGDEKTKCRGVSTETPVGAPLLDELQANDGAEFARQMGGLITGCLTQVKAEGSKAEGQSAEKTNQDAPNLSAEPIKCWDGTFQPQQDLCPPPPHAIARICPDGRGIGWPWECRSAEEIRIDDGKAACALQELKFDPGTNGCIP